MTTAVILPYRPNGCPYRRRAFEHTSALWPFPVVTGDCGDGPWNKALAVDDALAKLDDEVDVLVIADADLLVDGDAVRYCAEWVRQDGGWAVPHGELRRLTPRATAEVYLGLPPESGETLERYVGVAGAGLVCTRREDYARVPFDPRFSGWGQRDESWTLAVRTMLGKELRGKTPLFHCWHPPQERLDRRCGSRENVALHRRYVAAKGRKTTMERLLSEFR